MTSQPTTDNQQLTTAVSNVQQAIPFFMVSNMEASLVFYVEGLGFQRANQWIVDGKIRWCWLQLGGAALMLQEYRPDSPLANAKLGEGISICFQCKDALAIFHETRSRGLAPRTPFVGNNMWVTILADPDGYKLDFESPTDAPEETIYADTSSTSENERANIGQDVPLNPSRNKTSVNLPNRRHDAIHELRTIRRPQISHVIPAWPRG